MLGVDCWKGKVGGGHGEYWATPEKMYIATSTNSHACTVSTPNIKEHIFT